MFNQIVIGLIASYIFICAIPYTPAARYLLLGSLIITLLTGLWQKRFGKPSHSPVTWGFAVFVTLAFFSALNSPYLVDSLSGFRKDYLPPLLILIIATTLRQTNKERLLFAKAILLALLLGFAVKTSLALWDGAVNHPFIFSPYSNPDFFGKNGLPKYVSYYAVESVLYLTLTYSVLVFLCTTWAKRIAIFPLCCTSFFILMISGIRSAFAAALIGLLIITILKVHSFKRIMGFSLILSIIVATTLIAGKNNTEISRYADIVSITSYSQEKGMSGRYQIWEGVGELVAKRPWLGYGPGWQKIPTAAEETGLIAAWQLDNSISSQLKLWYFSLERGKVNPHNLALQVLFETGWLGLIAYAVMLATLFWCAFTAPTIEKTEFSQWLKFASIGYFAALLIIDVTNAFLMHNTMVALMLITVLTRQSANEKSELN